MRPTATLFAFFHLFFLKITAQPDKTLWYNRPAAIFEESLVLGNGKMGATVHGGIQSDKIFLNDATLWAGEPIDGSTINPTAYTHLPAVREALKNENYRAADSLNKKLQGKFTESYAPLGTLFLDMQHADQATNYKRTLSLNDAFSTTEYTINGVKYTREYFVSHPHQVMAIRLKSSQKGKLAFKIRFNSLLPYQNSVQNQVLTSKGKAPIHCAPSYRRENTPIIYDDNKGTRFTSLTKIVKYDGNFVATDTTIGIDKSTEAVILVSIATSFNGFDKEAGTQGLNDFILAFEKLNTAKQVSFNDLVHDIVQQFGLRIANRKGHIRFETKAKNGNMQGDIFHLSNVIINLLDNADKYSPNAPDIVVETANTPKGLRLSVIDKGKGMTAEAQKRIFDKFYRVPTGDVHDVKGFGLGLSYVKMVVEAHGGTIQVNSQEHQGTAFHLHLPPQYFNKKKVTIYPPNPQRGNNCEVF
jgi:two-component sensor histidine kinase